jgi:hypothetical protein
MHIVVEVSAGTLCFSHRMFFILQNVLILHLLLIDRQRRDAAT